MTQISAFSKIAFVYIVNIKQSFSPFIPFLFLGNYYSLRSEHQKAVLYFQRALSLDPQYLSAWILMGHEFIELQNSNAAIQCYRQAIGDIMFI